jgi:hypothetical protein
MLAGSQNPLLNRETNPCKQRVELESHGSKEPQVASYPEELNDEPRTFFLNERIYNRNPGGGILEVLSTYYCNSEEHPWTICTHIYLQRKYVRC